MATATKRPRNRRQQVADTAASLFAAQGYRKVTLDDVAGAVGVTGRAIYRHFANKQALLSEVVRSRAATLTAAASDVGALAAASLQQRDAGVLIEREARHLDPTAAAEIGAYMAQLQNRFSPAAIAVALSPSHHSVVTERDHELLASMVDAALAADASDADAAPPAADVAAARASRREAVLAAAIELFARHGYADTRMEDVGRLAGIAGPSIYEHFGSKADLLMAALRRGAEWLQLGITTALATTDDRAGAMRAVVESYVAFMRAHRDLMSVLLRETVNLPDADRHALRRLQHEYVAEWVRVLLELRPELPPAEAWFITHGALAVVNHGSSGGAPADTAMAVLTKGGSR